MELLQRTSAKHAALELLGCQRLVTLKIDAVNLRLFFPVNINVENDMILLCHVITLRYGYLGIFKSLILIILLCEYLGT